MRKTFLGVLVFRSISPEDKSEGGLRSSNQRRHERSEKI